MTVDVRLDGAGEVSALLTAVDTYARSPLTPDVADQVQAAVRREAPARSGALGRSIEVTPAGVTSALVYAGNINYGDRRHNIEANPFIARGWDASVADAIETHTQDLINQKG